jgi:asparagine synthase (glutamine-hydrolysing)
MASSLEVRVPLLDHTLVEWAATLPSHLKLHRREGKYIFKSALESHVPKEILYRPKQGFAVPLATWFRGPLRQRLRDRLRGPVLKGSGLFNMATIASLLDQHQSGERDHSAVLWTLSMMESFLRQVDGAARQFEGVPETADSIA